MRSLPMPSGCTALVAEEAPDEPEKLQSETKKESGLNGRERSGEESENPDSFRAAGHSRQHPGRPSAGQGHRGRSHRQPVAGTRQTNGSQPAEGDSAPSPSGLEDRIPQGIFHVIGVVVERLRQSETALVLPPDCPLSGNRLGRSPGVFP